MKNNSIKKFIIAGLSAVLVLAGTASAFADVTIDENLHFYGNMAFSVNAVTGSSSTGNQYSQYVVPYYQTFKSGTQSFSGYYSSDSFRIHHLSEMGVGTYSLEAVFGIKAPNNTYISNSSRNNGSLGATSSPKGFEAISGFVQDGDGFSYRVNEEYATFKIAYDDFEVTRDSNGVHALWYVGVPMGSKTVEITCIDMVFVNNATGERFVPISSGLLAEPAWYTYTVPLGTALHLEVDKNAEWFVVYNQQKNIGTWLTTPNFDQFSYKLAGDGRSREGALPFGFKAQGSRGVAGGANSFVTNPMTAPNGVINVFNASNSPNALGGTLEISVYTVEPSATRIGQATNSTDIISGTYTDVNEGGGASAMSGDGSADNPYRMEYTYQDGSSVNVNQIGVSSDDFNSDGVINQLIALLNSIFALPMNAINTILGWCSGFVQFMQGFFCWMPAEWSMLIGTALSASIVIGIIKMFL